MDVLEEISRILYECNADHDENIDEAEEFQFGYAFLTILLCMLECLSKVENSK